MFIKFNIINIEYDEIVSHKHERIEFDHKSIS